MSRNGNARITGYAAATVAAACISLASTTALAGPLWFAGLPGPADQPSEPAVSDSANGNDTEVGAAIPDRLQRRIVGYPSAQAPGTIVIDTPNTYLYFVLGGGKAIRYGIGVGREGFTWSGVKTVDRKAEWPDWIPPVEMIERQPYLPRFMAGGPQNPLGARAMYLSGTVYRIHGTNAPSTIGKHVSSGCIRMLNDDVTDLYARVHIGTKVVVLPMTTPRSHEIVGGIQPVGRQVSASGPTTTRGSGVY
jgi:lipoprotein-anchoring transpeptidase ErfK/SrfK